jgi:hypothetical protein
MAYGAAALRNRVWNGLSLKSLRRHYPGQVHRVVRLAAAPRRSLSPSPVGVVGHPVETAAKIGRARQACKAGTCGLTKFDRIGFMARKQKLGAVQAVLTRVGG